MVGCVADGVCPSGLSCGADQLCHVTGVGDCSEQVTGSFGHHLMANDGNGNPIETDLTFGADQLDVSAILADSGATPAITFDDDTFAFSRNSLDEPYRLSVRAQAETTVPTEVQDTVSSVELSSPYFGRIARAGVSKLTNVTFAMTGSLPARIFVTSTGLRTSTSVSPPTGSTTLSFTLDWRSATSTFGGLGLLSAGQGDVLWYTAFQEAKPDTIALDDYFAISGQASQRPEMSNGGSLAFTAPIIDVVQDHCVMLGLPRNAEVTRIAAASAFATAATFSGWNITSTPRIDLSPIAGIMLVEAASSTVIMDQNVPITFAEPYPGETPVVLMNAGFRRVATLADTTTGVSLTYSTTQYLPIPASTPTTCANVNVDANIAVPGPVTFGGTPLATDNQSVAIDRSGPVQLTFPPTGGAVDDWVVSLQEVSDANDTTTLTSLRTYMTLTPSVAIDPHLLVSGHSYIFLLEGRLGYPLAAARDYRTISYPFGNSATYSAIFTVQ